MGKRPSIIHDACTRFDTLKAINVSRHAEKQRQRADAYARGIVPGLAPSTGRIHSDSTLDTYKGMALRYVHWARDEQGILRLSDLDAQAERLLSQYLAWRMEAGASPCTVKTIRSALRMFYRPAYGPEEREERVRALGADVALPPRRREAIRRSRRAVAMDREIALVRYVALIGFCCATGLRRRELAALAVGDVHEDAAGGLVIAVTNGKGGKPRQAPVVPGLEESVRCLIADRNPEERLVARVPVRLDVHSYRRFYAQALYSENGRRALPPSDGRLAPGSIDRTHAMYVAHALGHARLDVLTRHYLR